jgi:hypothetical protein
MEAMLAEVKPERAAAAVRACVVPVAVAAPPALPPPETLATPLALTEAE